MTEEFQSMSFWRWRDTETIIFWWVASVIFVGHSSNKSTQLHLRYTLEKTAKGSKMFQNNARKLHDRREETADIVKFLRLRLQDTGGMTRLKNSLEIFTVQYFCSAHMKPTNLNSDPCEWFCYLLMGRVPLYQIWSRQIWSWQILELVTRLLNTASFVRGKLSSLLFARRYFERFNIWKKSDQNTTFPPLSAQPLSMYSTTPLLLVKVLTVCRLNY